VVLSERSLAGRLPSSRTPKLRTSLRFPFGCLANKRRKVAITLSMRRPVGVKRIRFVFRWTRFFSRRVAADALLPSALRRAMFSLSASWAFSLHPVLPPDYRPLFRHEDGSGPGVRRSHRNSAFGLCLSFSALVAKEVAFEQAAGDRSTVDLYECSAFSSAALMNGPRDRARKTPQVLPPRRRARPGAVWISSFCRSGMRLNAIDRISTGPVARKANQTYGH